MRNNQYEYEYHNVADDADFLLDQNEHTQEPVEIKEYIQEYNNYYHDIIEELDD